MPQSRHDSRGSGSRTPPVALVLFASLCLPAPPADAQAPGTLPPIDAPSLPRFGMELSTELSWQASPVVPPPRPTPRLSSRISPSRAFRSELREEAIDYRFTNPWAYADENLRGDRPVQEGRARAAENMLGEAAGAAMEVVLRDAFNRPRRAPRSEFSQGVSHQLRVDTDPTWRLGTRVGLTHFRFDVPLSAHAELGLRCVRRVDTDRHERQLSASVHLNPWDESIRLGFELQFGTTAAPTPRHSR